MSEHHSEREGDTERVVIEGVGERGEVESVREEEKGIVREIKRARKIMIVEERRDKDRERVRERKVEREIER